MIHIAICDDDKNFISYVKKMIIKAGVNPENVYFSEYTSGQEFVFKIDSANECDLLILDMQLGDMDGDDVAKIFRQAYPYAVLVFCSGVQLPTVKSFKATPFRYLLKSYSDEELIGEMKEILGEVRRNMNEEYIIGHYRATTVKVKIKNIMYITNSKRGSRIFVSADSEEYGFEEPILVDAKLSELYELYGKFGFEFASTSYIVNMRHVKKIVASDLILYTDEKLTITRSYFKEFREKFTRNLARKY